MQLLDGIPPNPTQGPSCDLSARRSELHDAEFVEHVPALQRQNAVSVRRQYGRFAPRGATSLTITDFLELPAHVAVNRYSTALIFAPYQPAQHATYADALDYYEQCAEDFYQRCDLRLQRGIVEWCDGGEYVSLCAIIEAERAMVRARRALDQRKDAPSPRQKFCTIDGQVFPVSRTPPKKKARTRKAMP